jgi:2-(1,2-epoxy-1,2-dihydrophenyl)acetyl-CoA isomerase
MNPFEKKYKNLNVSLKNYILTIELNNPDQHNALTDEVIDELCSIFDIANISLDVRVVILGAIGKSFCAGGDVKGMRDKSGMFAGESEELRQRYLHGIQRIPRAIESLRKPIIARLNGAAIGAGADMACMCDIRVGGNSFKFGETFCKLGLVPGDGGPYFLTRVLGHAKAMELYLTCEIIDSEEANRIGLLNHLVADSELNEKTVEIANQIANNAPVAISMTKQAIKASRNQELGTHLEMMATYQAISQRTSDHIEGIDALLEKRNPDFKGV